MASPTAPGGCMGPKAKQRSRRRRARKLRPDPPPGPLGRGSAAEGERAHPDPAQEGGDHGRGEDEGGDAAAGAAPARGRGRRGGRRGGGLGVGVFGVAAEDDQDAAHAGGVDGAAVAVAAGGVGGGELGAGAGGEVLGVGGDVVQGQGVGSLAVVGDLDLATGGDRGVVGLEGEVDGAHVDLARSGRRLGRGAAGRGLAGDRHHPFMAAGWTSQWNLNVPAWFRVTLALLPAKRPPSAPGSMTPVSKEPSSAVRLCGLPPTLATSRVVPAATANSGGSKRSLSPVKPGSTAWTRTARGSSGPGSTVRTPFVLAGLMRQK